MKKISIFAIAIVLLAGAAWFLKGSGLNNIIKKSQEQISKGSFAESQNEFFNEISKINISEEDRIFAKTYLLAYLEYKTFVAKIGAPTTESKAEAYNFINAFRGRLIAFESGIPGANSDQKTIKESLKSLLKEVDGFQKSYFPPEMAK